ncbi:MAG: Fic family protein [Coriobacteriia bacterium]|nr:Fic family protein [Coriobacteriia bacterium]MCL2750220.1 Fic family protein [Coriobacteriia bacterium]
MSYLTLKKAFHAQGADAEALYLERFLSTKAVHLDFEINGSRAFFYLDDALYVLMLQIAKADKAILELTQQLPGRAIRQYTERTLIDEIVLTNEIEGVNSSRKEIGKILRNLEKQDKKKRFFGLVNKYNMLIQREEVRIDTPKDIRALYDDLVLFEVTSDNPKNAPDGSLFRKDSVSVYGPAGDEIHRGVLPESKIEETLTSALHFLSSQEVDLPIKAAIFHYLLGYIHPFYDGNGRLNRFMSSALLMREYEPLVGLRLSYAITESIERYYKGFNTCNDVLNRGDLTPFVFMFLDVIHHAVSDIVTALAEKKELLKINSEYLLKVETLAGDSTLYDLAHILLQARMFSGDGIIIKELMSVFGVTRPTMMKRLEQISALNLLERERVGREVHYQLNLDVLHRIV